MKSDYKGTSETVLEKLIKQNVLAKEGKLQFYSESVYKKGKHAFYMCPECRKDWTEDDRWNAVCRGKFVPEGCEVDGSGSVTGTPKGSAYKSCRVHALMLHPMVETITSLVCEFAAAQRSKSGGNIEPLKDFWNSQLARPWRQTKAETDIERLRGHIGTYPAMKVPPAVRMLTAGIDVQIDHVFLRILGWGYLAEFWSIFEQRIETGPTERLENLEKVVPYLTRRWPLMEDEGLLMSISAAAIDRSYNTETVDSLCVKYMSLVKILPVMGEDKLQKQQWRTGQAAGGRIKRYDLNVTSYKDAMYRAYFESAVKGPGYGHLHKDTQHVVLEHLTSEHKDIKTKGSRIVWIGWVLKKDGLANHYWDCDVYARAAAEIAGLWNIASPDAEDIKFETEGKPVKQRKIRTHY